MSILIKGMDAPRCCGNCDWFYWSNLRQVYVCERTEEVLSEGLSSLKDKLGEKCPIIAVPTPHGRLIDADELKIQVHVMNWGEKHYPDKFMDEVVHAPTIIEAEE